MYNNNYYFIKYYHVLKNIMYIFLRLDGKKKEFINDFLLLSVSD